ncbi:hypothetical protein I316_02975 [Kwoniella heveanensis BCC8398]|uniref:Myb-like domain-containing protein n=1 Tax=Kwoniella heveanensis BCC8398 TaxID=1296120 RepID=A0A1B9GWM7_9TREE|nr:hypothetical protein I316_02975 [Kwoniella heveanensis BCC8398]
MPATDHASSPDKAVSPKKSTAKNHQTKLQSQTKLNLPSVRASAMASSSKTKAGGYDKLMLVVLVLKSANNTEWDALASKIDKTPTQCKDVWRKVIQPALINNQPWTGSGKGWTSEMKLETLRTVFESTNPDWEAIAGSFPGKTKTQVHDVWRKVILPRLRRGDTIE